VTTVAELQGCATGCVVATRKGVGTNGGCHCLEGLDNEKRRNVMRALYAYRAERETLLVRLAAAEAALRAWRGDT
jgi:hypothetical protein